MTPSTVTSDSSLAQVLVGMRNATEATTKLPGSLAGRNVASAKYYGWSLIATRGILSLAAKYRSTYLQNFYELGRKNIEQPAQRTSQLHI